LLLTLGTPGVAGSWWLSMKGPNGANSTQAIAHTSAICAHSLFKIYVHMVARARAKAPLCWTAAPRRIGGLPGLPPGTRAARQPSSTPAACGLPPANTACGL
jgi:hypothetical protein